MTWKHTGVGGWYAPYRPTGIDYPVPWNETATLYQLVELCLYIEGTHTPPDAATMEATLKAYDGFKPFIEQQMMRDLVCRIKVLESKVFELKLEKTAISPSHKDWAVLKKSIADVTAACREEYDTYLAMLKLNNIDYSYFKFKLEV